MDLLFPLAVIALASFINTLTGFGFALVTVPLLGMTLGAKTAVAVTPLLYGTLAPVFLWTVRRDVDRRLFVVLLLSGFVGLPLGTAVLVLIDEGMLRLLIGSTIVLAAVLLLADFRRPIKNRRAPVLVGFLTGILTTSVAVSGPLPILFMTNQGLPKEKLRATIAAFLMGMMPASLVLYALSGVVTMPVATTALKLSPALVAGYFIAIPTVPFLNPGLFRKLTIILVLLAGVSMIASGL